MQPSSCLTMAAPSVAVGQFLIFGGLHFDLIFEINLTLEWSSIMRLSFSRLWLLGSWLISSSITFNSAVRLVSLQLSLSLVAQTLSVCLISNASEYFGSLDMMRFLLVHFWAALSPYLVPMYVVIFSLDVQSMSPSLPLFPEPMVKMWPSSSLQAPSSDALLGTLGEELPLPAQPHRLALPPLVSRPPRPVSLLWAISRWNL